jgi:hypothetical protein
MAHFAEIDGNNKVLRVIVVNNTDCLNAEGKEEESVGIAFCKGLLGGEWVQTSYNATFRKNYAGIGFTYNADIDAFVPPSIYDSWILNNETARWDPPTPMPDDDKFYVWDEESTSWSEIQVTT